MKHSAVICNNRGLRGRATYVRVIRPPRRVIHRLRRRRRCVGELNCGGTCGLAKIGI